MNVWESIKIAFTSILAHKMRSLLTMLGIIIGVGSVIIVVAIGQGGEEMLKSEITGPGNTIEIQYSPPEDGNFMMWEPEPFTTEDIRVLQEIPEVKQVVTFSWEFSPVRYREESLDSAMIEGVNEAYFDISELAIAEGRSFTAADFLSGNRVAIISASIQDELFDGDNAVGEVIRIGLQPVEIIGVLEKPTGMMSFLSMDEVYLPWQTWRNVYGKSEITQVLLQATSAEDIQAAGEKAEDALNRLHQTEDVYQAQNIEELAEGIGQVTRIMTIIIGSIAGISLLVGGIGVMNIMLVSVTERTREIGIRMSLGATRGQITLQFLIEAMTLTLIGGIIGILLGAGASSLVSLFAGWPSLISWYVVVGAVLFSMVIGVIFGLLPANKASRLDPIESLRYE